MTFILFQNNKHNIHFGKKLYIVVLVGTEILMTTLMAILKNFKIIISHRIVDISM